MSADARIAELEELLAREVARSQRLEGKCQAVAQAIGLKLGGGQDGYLVPNVEAMARRLAELEAWLAAAPTNQGGEQ